jgi:hypothetical protein
MYSLELLPQPYQISSKAKRRSGHLAVVGVAAAANEAEGQGVRVVRDVPALTAARDGRAGLLARAVRAGRDDKRVVAAAAAVEADGLAAGLVQAARVGQFDRLSAALGASVVVAELRPDAGTAIFGGGNQRGDGALVDRSGHDRGGGSSEEDEVLDEEHFESDFLSCCGLGAGKIWL